METVTPRPRAASSGLTAPRLAGGDHFGDIIPRHAHLHRPDGHLEGVAVHLPLHHAGLAQRLQLHRVPHRDVPHQVRLRIAVSPVGAAVLGNHDGVELLAELPPQPRHAPLGFLRELLLRRPVVDRPHRLAHLVVEILQQRLQLLFQVAHLGPPLLQALAFQAALLPRHLLLAAPQLLALPRDGVELAVQLVEEVGNVLRLGVLLGRARLR